MNYILFQSWEYLGLLIITLSLVTIISNKTIKRIVILSASMLFYSYGAEWQTFIFLAVIILSYIEGLIVETKNITKATFTLMIIVLLSPLIFYKYIPFLLLEIFGEDVINSAIGNIVLPIGISFYTFQAIGYVIDVYRGKFKAEKNILTFACFLSFFPQLVAGPIERSSNLIHQIKEPFRATKEDLSIGFRHIIIGLVLKLLVAESMAGFVNPIYNNLEGKGGLAVLIATFCFGIQIYCDFNGYTQIAIGSAKLMGIQLMQNFNHPYRAYSISEFWRRWHISLTSWFTDYLYIPLGGNRKGWLKTARNTIITFLISGIWHGANWTFAMWGLVNGVAITVEKRIKNMCKQSKSNKSIFLEAICTYISVNLFWILFRANSIKDAFNAYCIIFKDALPQLLSLDSLSTVKSFLLNENGWSSNLFIPAFISMLIYIWYEYGDILKFSLLSCMYNEKVYVRWITYTILILVTLCFGQTLEQSSFVYFRF